jgi:phosphoribosyl-AMP cyclohydrolase / phosphoribosyl-ATP pyrophosphohydrolase
MTTPASDRRLATAVALDDLRFDDRGLVPVVAQDARSGAVFMVAWANREALELSLDTGLMHYWSRSRSALWKKGESSGNLQRIISLHGDCDSDTVLARVTMEGPACHTGDTTCFGAVEGRGSAEAVEGRISAEPEKGRISAEAEKGQSSAEAVEEEDAAEAAPGKDGETGTSPDHVLTLLWEVLEARDRDRPQESYTTRLLADENLRLKKLGEEMVELVTALARRDPGAPGEAADLLYHLLVALKGGGVAWAAVLEELERRRK